MESLWGRPYILLFFIICLAEITVGTQKLLTSSNNSQQPLRQEQIQQQKCQTSESFTPSLIDTLLSIAKEKGVLSDILPAVKSIAPNQRRSQISTNQPLCSGQQRTSPIVQQPCLGTSQSNIQTSQIQVQSQNSPRLSNCQTVNLGSQGVESQKCIQQSSVPAKSSAPDVILIRPQELMKGSRFPLETNQQTQNSVPNQNQQSNIFNSPNSLPDPSLQIFNTQSQGSNFNQIRPYLQSLNSVSSNFAPSVPQFNQIDQNSQSFNPALPPIICIKNKDNPPPIEFFETSNYPNFISNEPFRTVSKVESPQVRDITVTPLNLQVQNPIDCNTLPNSYYLPQPSSSPCQNPGYNNNLPLQVVQNSNYPTVTSGSVFNSVPNLISTQAREVQCPTYQTVTSNTACNIAQPQVRDLAVIPFNYQSPNSAVIRQSQPETVSSVNLANIISDNLLNTISKVLSSQNQKQSITSQPKANTAVIRSDVSPNQVSAVALRRSESGYNDDVQLPLNLHITIPQPAVPTSNVAVAAQPSEVPANPCPIVPPYNPYPPAVICTQSSKSSLKSILPILILALLGNGGNSGGSCGGYSGGGNNGYSCDNSCNSGCPNYIPVPFPVPVPIFPYGPPEELE